MNQKHYNEYVIYKQNASLSNFF